LSARPAAASLGPNLRNAIVLCAVLAGCATPSTPFEGRPVLVAIDFAGNHSIKSGELRDHIASQATSGFFSKTARYYDPDLFEIDKKRIIRWYNEKGFYEAKITDVKEERDDKGRVRVVAFIDEGRRARVGAIDYQGQGPITKDELHDIDDRLPMHKGDMFDEDDYEKSKDVLVREMKEHGFAEAKASGRVEVNTHDASAHIVYKLDPGQRYRFGRVMVNGARGVPVKEIVQAAGIDQGDIFKPSALELAQQRIYNLGAFAAVRVSLEPLGETPIAAVQINVREAPFQTTRFGIGGQVEESRWELPRLRTEYTNRNLFGGLRRLELASTVGYAFVPNIAQASSNGIATLTSAQLTVPTVFLPGLDFVSRAEFAREINFGFDYDEVAARASLVYRRGRHTVAPAINFVRYFKVDLPNADLQTLLNKGGQSLGLLKNCIPSCNLPYPEIRYTYDSRDNVLEPTVGFFATLDLQQTLKPGTFSYFRIEPEIRGYMPLGKYGILAGRVEYGALILEGPNQDPLASPFTQRFFGGGQSFQRGYAPLQQGPKVGGTAASGNPQFYTGYIPIGGNGSALISAEARLYTDFVLKHTAFVVFADGSRITPKPTLPWQGVLEVAPGIGLRYLTPFGPIRVDVAYVLNPQEQILPTAGNVQQTRVASACHQDPGCTRQAPWAYHITLGEAF
jgi:translocation and assembly module TamA